MYRGDQFFKMLSGKLVEDPVKKAEMEADFRSKFPFGVFSYNPKDCMMKVECKLIGNTPCCMKCGNEMIDRSNQKYTSANGWEVKKKLDNMSNWECPHCGRGRGGSVLMAGGCVGK